MGQTVAEKILSAHAQKQVSAGEICLAKVDFLMAQDGTAPLVIKSFEELEAKKVFDPEMFVLFLTIVRQVLIWGFLPFIS